MVLWCCKHIECRIFAVRNFNDDETDYEADDKDDDDDDEDV